MKNIICFDTVQKIIDKMKAQNDLRTARKLVELGLSNKLSVVEIWCSLKKQLDLPLKLITRLLFLLLAELNATEAIETLKQENMPY